MSRGEFRTVSKSKCGEAVNKRPKTQSGLSQHSTLTKHH